MPEFLTHSQVLNFWVARIHPDDAFTIAQAIDEMGVNVTKDNLMRLYTVYNIEGLQMVLDVLKIAKEEQSYDAN